MIKPIVYSISPFDAAKDFTIKFTYSYSQIFGRHVIIRDNTTNEIVNEYNTDDTTPDRMKQEHTIPAGTLQNGKTYSISISVFDVKGNESSASNLVVFSCYSTPVFIFNNIETNDIIGSPNYSFNLTYSQAEDITLDSYTIELYDFTRSNRLYTTGTMYDNALTATINGLTDNESYYIYAYGETVNGISMQTDYIFFTVDYVTPEVFTLLNLENLAEEGSVKLDSHFILVEGHTTDELNFENSSVDLIGNKRIIFDEGFNLNSMYSIAGILGDIQSPTTFMYISNGINEIKLNWYEGDFGQGNENYIELNIETKIDSTKSYRFITISNRIPPLLKGEQATFLLQRIDGYFNLQLGKVG